jgi:hypothetical protein
MHKTCVAPKQSVRNTGQKSAFLSHRTGLASVCKLQKIIRLSSACYDSNAGTLAEPKSVLFVATGPFRFHPWFIGLALLGANPMNQG